MAPKYLILTRSFEGIKSHHYKKKVCVPRGSLVPSSDLEARRLASLKPDSLVPVCVLLDQGNTADIKVMVRDLKEVPEKQMKLLLAVPFPERRYNILDSPKLLVEVGDEVNHQPGGYACSPLIPAIIRWIGPPLQGILVEGHALGVDGHYLGYDLAKAEGYGKTSRILFSSIDQFVLPDDKMVPENNDSAKKKKKKHAKPKKTDGSKQKTETDIEQKDQRDQIDQINVLKQKPETVIEQNLKSDQTKQPKEEVTKKVIKEKLAEFENLVRNGIQERKNEIKKLQNMSQIRIDEKSKEMVKLLISIDHYQDETIEIDAEVNEIERQFEELKVSKERLITKRREKNEQIQVLIKSREHMENKYIQELLESKERISELKQDVEELELKLQQTIPSPKEIVHPNQRHLDHLDRQIASKEAELECPVCFNLCSSPILMCSSQHPICNQCQPKVQVCPVCRQSYGQEPRRHRYAERMEEELQGLVRERNNIIF